MGCKDIGIRKSQFVAKTQFLCLETMCNGEGATTPTPHHTTPGSGLDCYYGSKVGDDKEDIDR